LCAGTKRDGRVCQVQALARNHLVSCAITMPHENTTSTPGLTSLSPKCRMHDKFELRPLVKPLSCASGTMRREARSDLNRGVVSQTTRCPICTSQSSAPSCSSLSPQPPP
jgi:hypothetical protein